MEVPIRNKRGKNKLIKKRGDVEASSTQIENEKIKRKEFNQTL